MATPSAIRPEVEPVINRHVNLMRQPDRRYALAYVAWLRGGACGRAPEFGRVSRRRAGKIRAEIDAYKPWG